MKFVGLNLFGQNYAALGVSSRLSMFPMPPDNTLCTIERRSVLVSGSTRYLFVMRMWNGVNPSYHFKSNNKYDLFPLTVNEETIHDTAHGREACGVQSSAV